VRGQHELDRQVEQRTQPPAGCSSSALRTSVDAQTSWLDQPTMLCDRQDSV
jgi:hypothetical protein